MSADDTLSCQPRIQPMWWLEKHDPLFFSPKISFSTHFDPRHLKNHRDLVKLIYDHQKANKPLKNLKSTWNKNYSRAHICCFRCFQGKKKPKSNPLII